MKIKPPSLDVIKSGLLAALWTFLGVFVPTALSWFQQLSKWASTNGHAPLPGLSVLGYAAIGALSGAIGGLLAFLFRYAQQTFTIIPGKPPTYHKFTEPDQTGGAAFGVLVASVVYVAVLLVLTTVSLVVATAWGVIGGVVILACLAFVDDDRRRRRDARRQLDRVT